MERGARMGWCVSMVEDDGKGEVEEEEMDGEKEVEESADLSCLRIWPPARAC